MVNYFYNPHERSEPIAVTDDDDDDDDDLEID